MKFLTFFLVLLTSTFAFGQSQFFAKFDNDLPYDKISSVQNRTVTNSDISFVCPFTIESDLLKRTFVLSGRHSSVVDVLKDLEPYIEYSEEVPDYQFFYTPNDYSSSQWNLDIINAQLAWDESTGDNVLIAIVDDAVEISHSDLNANIWTNPSEIPGNGIDDDNNGYIDDVNGWDVANGDNDPSPPSNATSSYFSHGTHCAGIASAVTDNNNGISSVGFNAQIIPVKIADDATSMITAAYNGVNYAISVDADVISMSWGGGAYSITYQNLFDFAYSQGIACIAAAGNNNTSTPMYPASYDHVISVGSTDNSDSKSSFSNYGASVDVMAPGSSIYSTVPNNSYGIKSGTSMATPLVAGLASLMIAKNSALTPDEIESCLESTCDNIDAQNPGYVGAIGAGRINAYTALQCVPSISAHFESNATFTCVNGQIQFTDLSNNNPTNWNWTFPGGTPSTSSSPNPLVTYSSSGIYDVQLIVQNSGGSDTLLLDDYVTVDIPSAQMSGNATIVQGASGVITVTLNGTPPFDYEYTDGTSNFVVSGVLNYIDQQIVSPSSTVTYSLVSMSDNGCSGSVSGSALIDIISAGTGNCGAYSVPTFHKEFESLIDDEARAIYSTSDGGVIILGASNSGFGQRDYSLIKVDSNYDLEWSRSVGTNGDEGFTFCDIAEDGQGNYLVIGATKYSSSSREVSLIKLDGSGNLVFASPLQQISFDQFNEVIVKSNGNYVVCGTTNGVISSSDYFIVEFSPTGSIVSTKVYGTGGNDHILQCRELSNGDFLVVGSTEGGLSTRDPLITIFDSNWNMISNVSYNMSSNREWFTSAIIKPNGNLLIQGRGKSPNERVLLAEITMSGTVIWAKSIPVAGTLEPTGIAELSNGTYGVSWAVKNNGVQNFYLAAIDDGGNLVWSKQLPTSSSALINHTDNLITTSNDGGIIVSTYGENSSSNYNNINLFKADVCGNIGCGETDFPVTLSTETITNTNVAFSSSSAGTLTLRTFSEQNLMLSDVAVCEQNLVPICDITADFGVIIPSCLTDTVFFEDLSTSSTNVTYWNWDLDDGTSISGDSVFDHNYQNTGLYDVELIVGNDDGCYDTLVQTVTISNNVQIILTDTTICVNDSVQLTPNIYCAPDTFTAEWTPTTGLNNPLILNPIASPSSSTTYTLTLTDQDGNTYSEVVDLTINTACCVSYPDFTFDSTVCIGASIGFTNQSNSSGTVNYEWDFGSNANPASYSGVTPSGVVFSSTGAHEVTLVLTDDCGIDSTSYEVYVNSLPKVNIIEDSLSCIGDTIELGENAIGNYIYSWNPSNLVSDSSSSNPYVIVDSIPTTYDLTVTDPFTGCTTIDQTVITGEVCLCNIYPAFTMDSIICINESIEVIDHSINSLGALDYRQWDMGDGTTVYGDSIYIHNFADTGLYEVELVVGLESICYDSTSLTVRVIDLPAVPIIADTTLCMGDTIHLGFSNDTSITYVWSPQRLFTNDSVSNPSIIVDSLIVVSLEVTGTDYGCSNSLQIQITGEDCNCYFEIPNVFTPNQDGVNELFGVRSINCDIDLFKVYNRWGQPLFISNDLITKWDGRTADGQIVPEGTYYYIIVIGNKSYTGPFHLYR